MSLPLAGVVAQLLLQASRAQNCTHCVKRLDVQPQRLSHTGCRGTPDIAIAASAGLNSNMNGIKVRACFVASAIGGSTLLLTPSPYILCTRTSVPPFKCLVIHRPRCWTCMRVATATPLCALTTAGMAPAAASSWTPSSATGAPSSRILSDVVDAPWRPTSLRLPFQSLDCVSTIIVPKYSYRKNELCPSLAQI